jgi:hypothetical protein
MRLVEDEGSNTEIMEPQETPINTMQICIAGWYFRPKFLGLIKESGYNAFVVKHREGDTQGLPSKLYPNVGLEFGAYRQFVENHWDRKSDVLFLHDDTELDDPIALAQAHSLTQMGVDHAYIFRHAYEELCNGGAHGRGMWMSAETIHKMGTIEADMENMGVNVGIVAQKGIVMFHKRVMQCGQNCGLAAIIPGFDFGHRGRMNKEMLVFRRMNVIPGAIINA